MKGSIVLATIIAFALVTPAFAQDTAAAAPAPPVDSADAQQPAPSAHHHRTRNRAAGQHYSPANVALTGNEHGTAAYQASDQLKPYPAVDHGHVPGDPPVIDHSGDQAPVPAPTQTTITVPPGQR